MTHTASPLASRATPPGTHILIADDSLFFRECIEQILNDAGATVNCAKNGAEALHLLDTAHYDCLLLDLNMPVMDGREAIQHIRSTPTIAEVRIIVMTGDVTPTLKEECLSAGADAVISKSCMRYDLLADIAQGVLVAP